MPMNCVHTHKERDGLLNDFQLINKLNYIAILFMLNMHVSHVSQVANPNPNACFDLT